MPMQPYICIAESVYDGKASWKAWGMEFMDLSPAEAAAAFVACYPKECGVRNFLWEDEEPIGVLVKNTDSGEIVRALVETELRYRRCRGRRGQEFHPTQGGGVSMGWAKYLCILEDNYQDTESWEYDNAIKCYAADAVMAAESAAEKHAEELGLFPGLAVMGETEEAAILVRNCDSGEIVRVLVETELGVAVTKVAVDKSFIPPRADNDRREGKA